MPIRSIRTYGPGEVPEGMGWVGGFVSNVGGRQPAKAEGPSAPADDAEVADPGECEGEDCGEEEVDDSCG